MITHRWYTTASDFNCQVPHPPVGYHFNYIVSVTPVQGVGLLRGVSMMKSYYRDTTVFDMLTSFILVENINSFQKLHIVLSLYERLSRPGTFQEIAKRFHFGDLSLLEKIISELQGVGLLTCIENRYQLSTDPDLTQYLQHLVSAFADPLTRQAILEQVQNQSTLFLLARSVLDKYEGDSYLF